MKVLGKFLSHRFILYSFPRDGFPSLALVWARFSGGLYAHQCVRSEFLSLVSISSNIDMFQICLPKITSWLLRVVAVGKHFHHIFFQKSACGQFHPLMVILLDSSFIFTCLEALSLPHISYQHLFHTETLCLLNPHNPHRAGSI